MARHNQSLPSEAAKARAHRVCVCVCVCVAGLVALWHVGFQFLDQGLNPHPLHWKVDSLPVDHHGCPQSTFFFKNLF